MSAPQVNRPTRSGFRPPVGRLAYVNGRYLAHMNALVHVEDRGMQFGDSVYEVVRVLNNSLLDEEEHLDRLQNSLRSLGIQMPMGRRPLAIVMRELIRRNHIANGLLYLQVTRGAMPRSHAIPTTRVRPSLILVARAVDPRVLEVRRSTGVSVLTRPDERWARCDIKTTQLVANVLAKTSAQSDGAYEAWLVDKQGFVTEGTSTTAWIVDKAGNLITRGLDNSILPGVTRGVILNIARDAQLPVIERAFTPAEASNAAEAFISSATGIFPVVSIDNLAVGVGLVGPTTKRILDLYDDRSSFSQAPGSII